MISTQTTDIHTGRAQFAWSKLESTIIGKTHNHIDTGFFGMQRDSSPPSSNAMSNGQGNYGEAKRKKKRVTSRSKHMTILPEDFEPGPVHVVCAKGKQAKEHPGNILLKSLVQKNLVDYSACISKSERTYIVTTIMQQIRDNGGGEFVRQLDGRWYEIGDRNAREKIGQAFRDSLHTQFRSSTKAKASIRRGCSSDSMNSVSTQSQSPKKAPAAARLSPIHSTSQSNKQLSSAVDAKYRNQILPGSDSGGTTVVKENATIAVSDTYIVEQVISSHSSSRKTKPSLPDQAIQFIETASDGEPLPLSQAVEMKHSRMHSTDDHSSLPHNLATASNESDVFKKHQDLLRKQQLAFAAMKASDHPNRGDHADISNTNMGALMKGLHNQMKMSAESASKLLRQVSAFQSHHVYQGDTDNNNNNSSSKGNQTKTDHASDTFHNNHRLQQSQCQEQQQLQQKAFLSQYYQLSRQDQSHMYMGSQGNVSGNSNSNNSSNSNSNSNNTATNNDASQGMMQGTSSSVSPQLQYHKFLKQPPNNNDHTRTNMSMTTTTVSSSSGIDSGNHSSNDRSIRVGIGGHDDGNNHEASSSLMHWTGPSSGNDNRNHTKYDNDDDGDDGE